MSHSPQFSQVVVGSINDWQKERQFKVLNEKKEERGVKVIRNGVERLIDVKVSLYSFNSTPFHHLFLCVQEVVVGDVALSEPGEIDPCDGIFLL
jgi:Ca2+-transporting ATPase